MRTNAQISLGKSLILHISFIFLQDWYSPDIEVIICNSHEDSGLCGQIGVVRGVTPGKFPYYFYCQLIEIKLKWS